MRIENRIGCKIHSNLPWHSQRDISDFFGKSIATINEHVAAAKPEDTLLLLCKNTEGNRVVTRKIKHYSFNHVASLCYRIRSISHTNRYKKFLFDLGIVWPEAIPVPCDEKNFAIYISEIFGKFIDIDLEYKLGKYTVDGYVKSLNLAFELDGKYHRKGAVKKYDVKRELEIKRRFGIDLIRAPSGKFTQVATELISRMLQKKYAGHELRKIADGK